VKLRDLSELPVDEFILVGNKGYGLNGGIMVLLVLIFALYLWPNERHVLLVYLPTMALLPSCTMIQSRKQRKDLPSFVQEVREFYGDWNTMPHFSKDGNTLHDS